MKALSLSIFSFILFASISTANAQLSPSSEPRAQIDQHSGDLLITPFSYIEEEEVVVVKKTSTPIIRNVSQKRDAKMGQMRNGYYQMPGGHDWGTNARLNSYGYVKTITKVAAPDSGVAQAAPATETTPLQLPLPIAFK